LRAESDPAYLSAKLRELAMKAYQAVRNSGDARSGSSAASAEFFVDSPSPHDWADLHSQIVQLERAFDAQHLDLLACYVGALRREVENCLD